MKLRSGAHVVQAASISIAQYPKDKQPIAEHNASSHLLVLPQEVKNRIYYFVLGGHTVHIFQNDQNHHHVHGDNSVELSHATCLELTSEEQVQGVFDSADPGILAWNVTAAENRHAACHGSPPRQGEGPKPDQLSLTLLRTCRQTYLEARMVQYTKNIFAINCHDILGRFVSARWQNQQNLAVRSLYLEISVTHDVDVDAWSDSIHKAVLKRLKSVRRLYLNLAQLYCSCSIDDFGYDEAEMTERQGAMFKKFSKLKLNKVTLIIDDAMFEKLRDPVRGWHFNALMEREYRWTMKQKQAFSKDVRDALLRRQNETR